MTTHFQRLDRVLGTDTLSLEEKVRCAMQAAKFEMSPVWRKALRELPVDKKIEAANELFVAARDLMYLRECEHNSDALVAWQNAIQKLLDKKNDDW